MDFGQRRVPLRPAKGFDEGRILLGGMSLGLTDNQANIIRGSERLAVGGQEQIGTLALVQAAHKQKPERLLRRQVKPGAFRLEHLWIEAEWNDLNLLRRHPAADIAVPARARVNPDFVRLTRCPLYPLLGEMAVRPRLDHQELTCVWPAPVGRK